VAAFKALLPFQVRDHVRAFRTTAVPPRELELSTQTGYWAIRIRSREAVIGPKAIR